MDISIIVPNFNGSRYLSQCLSSLVSQDFEGSYEIILVDDGSTDDSLEIASQFESVIKLVKEYNSGLSYSRNYGIERCRGQYVCFVDSDDFVEPNYLSQLFEGLVGGSDLVVSSFYGFHDSGVRVLEGCNSKLIKSDEYIQDYLDAEVPAVVWNKIYRADIIRSNQIRFKVGLQNEDLLFNLQYLMHCNLIKTIGVPLYYYRQHAGSITKKLNPKIIYDMAEVSDEVTRLFARNSRFKSVSLSGFYCYYLGVVGFKRTLAMGSDRIKTFAFVARKLSTMVDLKSVLHSTMISKRKIICAALVVLGGFLNVLK